MKSAEFGKLENRVQREERCIEGFQEFEIGRAKDIIVWHLQRGKPMSPGILRSIVFFLGEDDPEMLKVLFDANVVSKTPPAKRTKPLFEQCCWRYKKYAKLLEVSWLNKHIGIHYKNKTKERQCEKE
jgi:hypothetical protein